MAITTAVYTTREIIKRALDIAPTARIDRNIDRAIESGARRVDGLCHRTFYPQLATKYFDWPNYQRAIPWRLWLDDTELISATTVVSGGITVPSANYNLESNRVGPPYDRLEINISTSSALSAGSTYQRSTVITGLWGYSNEELTLGPTAEALDATETGIDISAAVSAEVGVGSILRIDDERVIVTDRAQLDTGVTLGAGLTNSKNDVSVAVADGTQFVVDEIILIDSERMLIVDIAGNTLTVIRAYDGSTLATHTLGVHIWAQRTLTVIRGALGTTAATHTLGATVYAWKPPAGIRQLNTTEAIHELLQEQTGWFRTMSASSNFGGTAKRSASMDSILDIRESTYRQYGRKARVRSI